MTKKNNNMTKKRKNKNAPRKKKKAVVRQPGVSFNSKCAADYFKAIASPFSAGAIGACVPTFPSRSSQKITSRVNGVFQVGTAMGFVAVMPCLANDISAGFVSNSDYAGSTLTLTSGNPGAVTFDEFVMPMPYDNTTLDAATDAVAATVRGRIVSCAVRIRYIGTALNMGGRVVAYSSPDHNNLNGQTFDQIAARKGAVRLPVSRDWVEVVVYGNTSEEMEYPHVLEGATGSEKRIASCYPLSGMKYLEATATGPLRGGTPLVILTSGVQGNEFEYEVITHAEYIGAPTTNSQTPSHCDIVGLSQVQDAAASGQTQRASSNSKTQWGPMLAAAAKTVYRHRNEISSVVRMASSAYGGGMPSIGRLALMG